MPNDKWTDESIEDLLKDFPAIKDHRPKEEVYNRLVQKEKVRKRPKRWLPLLAAALAFITIGILVAAIITQNGIDSAQNPQNSNEESQESSSIVQDGAGEETEEVPKSEEPGGFTTAQVEEGPVRTAAYEELIGDQTLMTIGLTENAFVVPVSFLIPGEQVKAVFGDSIPSSLEMYQEFADDIDETQLRFDEYNPYVGTLEETSAGIRHLLPSDHAYDLASAGIGVYFNTLAATFPDATEIEVANEDGSPAEFAEIGFVDPVIPEVENLAYYSYPAANGEVYLVPGYDMPFGTASEAIEALADSPNDFYQATIPENIDFEITETEGVMQVEFKETVDLDSLDRLEAVRMIESFVLTAAAFDKELAITGVQPENWNSFDFSQPLPIPAAPNLMAWPIP